MILIFSENISYSARYVARHLYKMKERFEMFLENDTIDFTYILEGSSTNLSIFKNGTFICKYDEVKSVWAHRNEIVIDYNYPELTNEELIYIKRHRDTQVKALRHLLHKKKCLGQFGSLNFNKIVFLDVCKDLKIDVPKTLITRNKKDLIPFFKAQKNGVIVKSIARNFHHCVAKNESEQIWQHGITNTISSHQIELIPDTFDLSLFQEKLDKKYELRVLYIDGTCFPQIIFSQKNSFSEIDYRQGLGDSEMRQCNFKLSLKLSYKIKRLMNALSLNIGCIDIVVTKDNKEVFLEVNPSGIFTDMMDNCNYDMHYEIAKYLRS